MFGRMLARYETDAGQSISDITTTIINYEDVVNDGYGLVTVGAGWNFEAIVNGYYYVNACITTASVGWDAGEGGNLRLYRSGNLYSYIGRYSFAATITDNMRLAGGDLIYLVSGQYVDIRVYIDRGAATSLTANGDWNYVSIHHCGYLV